MKILYKFNENGTIKNGLAIVSSENDLNSFNQDIVKYKIIPDDFELQEELEDYDIDESDEVVTSSTKRFREKMRNKIMKKFTNIIVNEIEKNNDISTYDLTDSEFIQILKDILNINA